MRARAMCCVMGALVVVGAGLQMPAADGPAKAFPLPELEPAVLKAVDIVRAVNDGELDRAISLTESLRLPENEASHRAEPKVVRQKALTRLYSTAVDANPQFDSVELVGFHRTSSAAYHVYLVANGMDGPLLFQAQFYRWRGAWYIGGLRFSEVFAVETDSKIKAFTPLPEPVVYPLTPKRPATKKAAEVAIDPNVNPFK